MLQKRSILRNILYNLFKLDYQNESEPKTNIKSRVVERIRKGIFKIIDIFISILKSKL